MEPTATLPGYVKASHILFIILASYLILSFGSDILITFFIALFFSFLLMPVSAFLQRKGFHRGLSILFSILLALAIIFGLIFFFTYQIVSFREDLPQLRDTLIMKYTDMQQMIEQKFHLSRREQTAWMNKKIGEYTQDASTYIMGILTTTGTVVANLALIPIYIFFLTLYQDKIMTFIYSLVQKRHKRKVYFVMTKVCRVSQHYIKGLLIDVLILSVLNSTGFLLLGLKHAILFGVLAAFLNIIPYVGVMIGSILPILLALLTKDSVWYAVGAAGVCVVVQFLDNNFITPKVVGSSVSINPLAAILVLLVGAKVWGVVGMVLSIPLMGMLKVLFDQIHTLKPVGFLIGEEEKMPEKNTKEKKSETVGVA